MNKPLALRALLGDYPVTHALRTDGLHSSTVEFDFANEPRPSAAFKRVVRSLEFDVAELAIVTFLMAKSFGKPLVLLPAVVLARFQHPFLVYDASRGTLDPGHLNGRRIGIRSWTVTTVVWLRGILADLGVDADRVTWVTFEEAHVAEFVDPRSVRRASPSTTLLDLLRAGEIDAAIVAEPVDDPRIRTVFADPAAAARSWQATHRALQINHMVVMRQSIAEANPDAVREVWRLLATSKRMAGLPAAGTPDVTPFGVEANRRNLEVAIGEVHRQGLIPRLFAVDELFDPTTGALG